jgi:hypothetical protein
MQTNNLKDKEFPGWMSSVRDEVIDMKKDKRDRNVSLMQHNPEEDMTEHIS